MNHEIVLIMDWLIVNKLSINLKKTHFIIFQKRRAKFNTTENLTMGGEIIERKSSTKFLGVIIDKCLTFQEHILYIKGKLARGLGILYRCKRCFNKKTMLTLYNSLVYPYLTYCITVWGNTYDLYLNPIISLQKRAIRLIANVKKSESTDIYFRQLKILKFRQIYIYMVQQTMFEYHHLLLPPIFEKFFNRNRDVHSLNTRSQNLFRPPLIRSDNENRTIRATGERSWKHFSKHQCFDCSLFPIRYH